MSSEETTGFGNLGLAPKLLEILSKLKFVTPTPIQERCIPIAVKAKDLMGIAQTGTGKTLAFGLPMIQLLAQSQGAKRGLILLPTRELALQVDETLKKIGSSLGLKTAVLIGGEPIHKQARLLRQLPHIIVGTPGRINDHLENNKLDLSKVGILILDEADRMLDMGFAPQIKKILAHVPKVRQTMLFSATMPNEIVSLANSYMTLPLRVEVAPAGTAVKTVTQELFFVEKNQKNELLKTVLEEYKGSVLVFTRTKYKARDVARVVRRIGHASAEIHSERSLNQRREALEGFKLGKYRVLVATDIAARGIDVSAIQLVINYDLPDAAEDYVHRIGRTGRAGLTGHAISFATHDQRKEIRNIERLIRKNLNVSQTPKLTTTIEPEKPFAPQERSRNYERPRNNFKPKGGFQKRNDFGRKPRGRFKEKQPAPRRSRPAATDTRPFYLPINPKLDL